MITTSCCINHLSTLEQSFCNSFNDEIISTWKYFVIMNFPPKRLYCSEYIFGPNFTHYHFSDFFLWLVSKYFWKIQETFFLFSTQAFNALILSLVHAWTFDWLIMSSLIPKHFTSISSVFLLLFNTDLSQVFFSVFLPASLPCLWLFDNAQWRKVNGDLWTHLKKAQWRKASVEKSPVEKSLNTDLLHPSSPLCPLIVAMHISSLIPKYLFSIWKVFLLLLNTDLLSPSSPLCPLVVAYQRKRQALPPPWAIYF